MKLKKNDKIILIIGVVVLIAAGAGIALYNINDADDASVAEDTEGMYSYSWSKKTSTMDLWSDTFVSKSVPLMDDNKILNAPKGSVLSDVVLRLKWEDDRTHGLLNKNKGLDTLDIEISHDGYSETYTSVGSDDHNFTFSIHNKPSDNTIEATSKQDARDRIDDSISGDNTAIFDISVTVTPGEKIWRPLKQFMDKGNDFDIIATYHYYVYMIDDEDSSDDDSDDDTKETGSDVGHGIGEYYMNLCYGRGMI